MGLLGFSYPLAGQSFSTSSFSSPESKCQSDRVSVLFPFLVYHTHYPGALIQSLAINPVYILMTPKFIWLPWTASANFSLTYLAACLTSPVGCIMGILALIHAQLPTDTHAPSLTPKSCFSCIFPIPGNVNFILTVAQAQALELCWTILFSSHI